MAIFGLMYHRTPDEPWHVLDVAMARFRDQIRALRDSGFEFIAASEAAGPKALSPDPYIAVTFDDGHASNLEAMAFMHDEGLPSTAFIVRDFTLAPPEGFMDAALVVEASQLGEIGAHGATHTALTSLSPTALADELRDSRAFLSNLCGREVTSMSAPGGAINGRVVRAARKAGYCTIANSRGGPSRSSMPLNRLGVTAHDTPHDLLRLVRAGSAYWAQRNARRLVGMGVRGVVGDEGLARVRRFLGRQPRQERVSAG